MDPFSALRVSVPVAIVVQYSVAIAVAVNIFGFVVATLHYARAGFHPARLPLRVIWGAGMSFTLFTWFFVHIGYASASLAKAGEPGEGLAYLMLAFMATHVLASYFLRYYGPLVYRLLCVGVGALWAFAGPPRPLPLITPEVVTFPVPAFAVIVVLAFLWLYGNIFYGDLARALGGAAPSPVILVLTDDYAGVIPVGARVYELIADGASVTFELEFDDASGVKRRDDMTGVIIPFRNKYPPVRYVRLPQSAVRHIEYTDTHQKAPAYASAPTSNTDPK